MAFDRVPLNWIRTFEAAARLRSFQNAALELHVTPGAISQQIRKLELELGQTLFYRAQYPVALTETGEELFERVTRPLQQIEQAILDNRNSNRGKQINVWGSRFFMRLWLLPRLQLFNDGRPDLLVDLTTAPPLAPVPCDCDIAIRVGFDGNPDLHGEELLRRVAVPVCSPEYLRRHGPIGHVREYAQHHLLKGSLHDDEWGLWLALNNLGDAKLSNITTLSSSDLVHAAALEGVGIALGRLGFIENDLKAGRLVQLPGNASEVGAPFYLHYRKDRASDPAIRAFTSWLRKEMERCTLDFPPVLP
ncbi:LysR substrate-binding domain-containing protein [Ensifer adhaerens]|uniref:LysR substrate-binding domain-containing protein n=1 Tax=Ensifer adhaerens TaxID=106592 RepID=UPI0023A9760C|nr:LysR substrate-binding domain-containing protein [Ensifer adhaerens]WDZ76235.1 LysR substrate-binding domain-containing protein [Ensifer adhaerens]